MKTLDFETAFKYPFNRAKGMLNILWILLPIFGWFALGGYIVRITQEFCKGKFKKLPEMTFSSDMKLGFFMFFKALPLVIAYGIVSTVLIEVHEWFVYPLMFVELFVLPMMFINFFKKETIESSFDFKVVKAVFDNFSDYLMALLKSIVLGIIFFVMIIVLVGLPAGAFTKHMFLADFYRRNVK